MTRPIPTSSITCHRNTRSQAWVDELAENIGELGQLQPIVVTPERVLLAGEARYRACKKLGIDILARFMPADDYKAMLIERAENAKRRDPPMSVRVKLAQRIEQAEKVAAGERRAAGGRKGKREKSGAAAPLKKGHREGGRAATRAAEAAGISSRKQYQQAKAILAAAEAEPERYGHLVEELDAGKSVTSVHRKLAAPDWSKDSWSTDRAVLKPMHVFWPDQGEAPNDHAFFGCVLDVCANEWSIKLGHVAAKLAWTIDDDSLSKDSWDVLYSGEVEAPVNAWMTLWLQPPYSNPGPFIDRLCKEWDNGNLDEVLVLVKLDTSTEWAAKLRERCVAKVEFDHRLGHYAGDQLVKGSDFCSQIYLLTRASDPDARIEALKAAYHPIGGTVWTKA